MTYPRKKLEPTLAMLRQTSLGVYGDGPYDEDLGHPSGWQDVATITFQKGFCVVRTEYLDALIALTKSQEARLAQLEKKA